MNDLKALLDDTNEKTNSTQGALVGDIATAQKQWYQGGDW